MNTEKQLLTLRNLAYKQLDAKSRNELGQYYTPYAIAQFMASLFSDLSGDIKLLDPGCGIASLSTAVIEEIDFRDHQGHIEIDLFEIENRIEKYLIDAIEFLKTKSESNILVNIYWEDFLLSANKDDLFNDTTRLFAHYTHCIMNPPYKKIPANGLYRKTLKKIGIETGNLYAAFAALAILRLRDGGELIAIIPRSFCNGPYFKAFRKLILDNTAIKHIHVFNSRNKAFNSDDVLQENIIIHLIKGMVQGNISISSSSEGNFHRSEILSEFTASDLTICAVDFSLIVKPTDPNYFIHIATSLFEESVTQQLSVFTSQLHDIKTEVSTGPIVGCRSQAYLSDDADKDSIPLFYPAHFTKGVVEWPSVKKSNSLKNSYPRKEDIWKNTGTFVLIKRFSAKEEKKRVVAYLSETDHSHIAFENKLNVFHFNHTGLPHSIAKGLYVFLNSTLLDLYFRQFSGHTQVNAADLRNIGYPSVDILDFMGTKVQSYPLTQKKICAKFERNLSALHSPPVRAGRYLYIQS
ncbi:MAG: Eco57I restriction-modification methylase domain-containing protein [Salinispira sp.]